MKTFSQFILEGGAAGHMAHPFDLPNVNTGSDLINVFKKIAESLKNKPSAVKIDGINSSIKLVTTKENNKEFALDRGSNKTEDIEGVTLNKLQSRFPEGHGMIEVGRIVLKIFNKALPEIKSELKLLKMWNNSKILFNMEYIKGSTNVIGYANNFLAIHGLNEIYEVKSPVRGSISRASSEIPFDKNALLSLIKKVNPIAKEYGFDVENEFEVDVKDINFNDILKTNLTIKYNNQESDTKSLESWLLEARNPKNSKIKTKNGKTINAMSLENYKNIISNNPLDNYLESMDDSKKAIDGALFYYATIKLGDKIKQASSSKLGNIEGQEGIVVRDSSISNNPVKITGSFITGKEAGKFARTNNSI